MIVGFNLTQLGDGGLRPPFLYQFHDQAGWLSPWPDCVTAKAVFSNG